jgi:hypothetical protein
MTPLTVSRADAAKAIGISVWSLDQLILDGRLPVVKLPSSRHVGEQSRRVLIAVADLEKFIEQQRSGVQR